MKLFISIFSLTFLFTSCIVVKYDNKKQETPLVYDLAPQSQIPISNTLVRSESGDMIGFLPVDWFFVDLGEDAPSETFSVAVNPDYTLSAVFSKIRSTASIMNASKNDDLLKIAEDSYKMQQTKSGGKAKIIGNFKEINVGRMKFMTYKVTTTAGAVVSNVAVFKSTFDNLYMFSIIPMDIIGKPIPSQKEVDVIFESLLTTIKF